MPARLLEKLDGMFSFALYSVEEQALFLARDPFGKKPCYYLYDPHGPSLAFSSDIRSFQALNVVLSFGLHAFGYYLAELATPEGETIWREVRKLPGGHFLRVGETGISLHRYWSLEYTSDNRMPRAELVARADHLIKAAVRKRLVGDVRCAALLSGGVDSSLVVSMMAQTSGPQIRTYTVGFEEDGFDERPYARQTARRWATDHHEIVVRACDTRAARGLLQEFGEPFADLAALPTYLVARAVAEYDKVVLTGDGGDELFAGYYIYYFANKLNLVKRLGWASPVAKMLVRLWPSYRSQFLCRLLDAAGRPEHSLLDRGYGFSSEQVRRLVGAGCGMDGVVGAAGAEHAAVWRAHAQSSPHTLTRVLAASLHTRLSNDYLVKVDRATMYASLEARLPLLDKELARFAATLTPAQIFDQGQFKSVLKDVAAAYVPKQIISREKAGFAVPVGNWLRAELNSEFRETVLGGRQSIVPLDYGWIEDLLAQHCEGAEHTHRLWALYAFHVWAQHAVSA